MSFGIESFRWFRSGAIGPAMLVLLICGPCGGRSLDAADAGEFFETRIRPLLVERCRQCHGGEKREGGLAVTSRRALLRGGLSGPAIMLGNADASGLVRVVEGSGPSFHRLSEEQAAALRHWIEAGAVWPGETSAPAEAPILDAQTPERIERARREHWALRPVRRPTPPDVQRVDWALRPVDRFVLSRLEAHGLEPSPPADRRTLIRRAYFDLIGLPPTYEQVRAFVNDPAPDAFERVVERLLADPRYGERWGRHWLDVARYADTKGYVFTEDRRYPFAYTYRDYVVRAFNEDKPYDRFLIEQLAADKLDLPDEDRSALAALGFLTVGRRFGNKIHDIIDDRIDVVGRGLLGLTLACARCHDHKYDPIPTEDYYALYGVFRSATEPDLDDMPVIEQPRPSPAYEAYQRELAERKQAVEDFIDELIHKAGDEMRSRVGDYLVYIAGNLPKHKTGRVSLNTERGQLRPGGVRLWERYLAETRRSHHPVWAPLHAMAELEREGFAEAAARIIEGFDRWEQEGRPVNPLVAGALKEHPPHTLADVAKIYGELLEDVHRQWKELLASYDAGEQQQRRLDDPAAEQLRRELYAEGTPTALTRQTVMRVKGQGESGELNRLRGRINELYAESPAAPARAMVLVDDGRPFDPYVFRRGSPDNRGAEVPRRFLRVLSEVDGGGVYRDGSGRLELARAIADPDNPLTARVLVNRIWMHHFGEGLVSTPSDFGLRSDPPSHPLLLDWLASRFVASGWSIKDLHRTIMLSATYRQASVDRPDARAVDPENRLLWRQNRQRLEFEPLRDAMLAVAGRLSGEMGGRPVRMFDQPEIARRTIYGFVDRQDLPGVLRTFDFASPDASSPGRPQTTVPQQALFMMNAPFVVMQARHVVERLDRRLGASRTGAERRIEELYRLALGRDPSTGEMELAASFLESAGSPEASPGGWEAWRYGYGRYDPQSQRLASFEPLPHFNGEAWQGGAAYPDSELHYLRLTADGGHVGVDRDHAAVRRWVAPRSGVVRIEGVLRHPSDKGDGVQAWAVSSRSGELGRWVVHHGSADTHVGDIAVEAGERIDFIADCQANHGWDSFEWPVALRMSGDEPNGDGPVEWEAAEDFAGPDGRAELSPWQRLAQVLLMSNEFAFVD